MKLSARVIRKTMSKKKGCMYDRDCLEKVSNLAFKDFVMKPSGGEEHDGAEEYPRLINKPNILPIWQAVRATRLTRIEF